ncbi:hypothetical protein N7448_005496 [Penicillium atrosanguineum]|uniref:Uncharacterized protein n=1 Tax=Penicillium atrosanguineum TaxID=1132637 RepID=A0A9W9PNG4_9EURO|nr:hypothetical protein N7448_005496 [Penicillium atrosanguineum]KAJ5302692.1 hypothetical protein N7476_009491 [Penicillium atrosanguineum]
MGRKSKKHMPRVPECEIEYEPESRQSSVESWKARYDDMLDIALMETQEEKDAAMAKIEVGKNSYVDSLRNKSFGFGFNETMESAASGNVEYTISKTMDAASGNGSIGEKEELEVRVVVVRPRRSRKGRKDGTLKQRRLAVHRAEEAIGSVWGSLGDIVRRVLGVVWGLLFNARFHLALELFTAAAVAVAVSLSLGGDELPFRLMVLGIGLAVHGVLSLK